MKLMRHFFETVESERELRNFSAKLLPYLSADIYTTLVEYIQQIRLNIRTEEYIEDPTNKHILRLMIYDTGEYGKTLGTLLLSQSFQGGQSVHDVHPSEFLNSFYDFISDKENALIIVVEHDPTEASTKGGDYTFSQNRIRIFIDLKKVKSIYEVMLRFSNKARAINAITSILSEINFSHFLLHELTHVYDDFISGGKVLGKDYKTASKDDPESYKKYFSQDIEVNAFYSGLVEFLERFDIKYIYSFETLIENISIYKLFGVHFDINYLDEDQKKRVYTRLYQWYTEPDNPKKEKKGIERFYNLVIFKLFDDVESNKVSLQDFSRGILLNRLQDKMKEFEVASVKGKVSVRNIIEYLESNLMDLAKKKVPKKKIPTSFPSKSYLRIFDQYDFILPLVQVLVDSFMAFDDELRDEDFFSTSPKFKLYLGCVKYLSEYVGFSPDDFVRFSENFRGKLLFPVNWLQRNKYFRPYVT